MNLISQKVSFREKAGYSLGDMAANFVFQMMMMFQLQFYTDVFGLAGTVAGSVLLIARIADAFVDPVVGILSDRTNTKWGKYRPWVVWTAIPFCVFYVLAFYNPGIENKAMLAGWATFSYIMLMAAYSFNNTPYSSLAGVMSSDIKERTSIASTRFVFATIATFIVQGLTLPLVNKFGMVNGTVDKSHGWFITILIFSSIALIFLIIAGISAKERISPPANQKTSVVQDVKDIFGSLPWRSMFILTLFLFITLAMWGSAMSFYFNNYVDPNALLAFISRFGLVDEAGTGSGVFYSILNAFGLIAKSSKDAYAVGFSLFNMVGSLIQFFGVILLSNYLANRFGKKQTFFVCMGFTTIATALFFLPTPQNISLMFTLNIFKSMAYAPTVPLLWAMMADVADESEFRNHRRATGFVFAGIVFGLKAGLGIGGALCGAVISFYGYDSTLAVQTDSALQGIRMAASIIPGITFFICFICLFFYPISKQRNEEIQQELTLRRANA